MEKLHSRKVVSPFFLLLLLLHLSSLQLVSSDYTPQSKYFINCGSKSNYSLTSLTNRAFVGDENSGGFSFTSKSSTDTDNSPTRNPSLLYQTARIFKRQSSYKFTIDENGTYLVRLHFYPFSSHTAVFNVSIQGFSLLSNFSVPRNSTNSPVIKEFLITINSKQFIIQFTPYQSSFAFVNALEVFLAPGNFIPNDAPRVTPAGKSHLNYRGLLSQALQTLYRINVGGESLVSDNDTLWRNWTPDDSYLVNQESTTNKSSSGGNIKYEDGNVTEYIAPYPVYNTARTLNVKSNISNIAWRFDVSKNASHLVRLHFCDIQSMSQNILEFNLCIYSKFNQSINPYELTFLVAEPFCLDFVVDSDDSGFMNISVGAKYPDQPPILNGLEIWELMKDNSSVVVGDESENNHLPLIVGLAAGGVVIISIFMIVVVVVVVVSKRRKASASDVPNLKLGLKIPFSEIKRATNNFNKKKLIGSGGFGKVYLGTLRNGIKVAVKRGEAEHGQGFSEFQTEIMILSKIRHRHLVSLIGYCDEGSEMILVYEFMEKGTLRDHLYNSSKNSARPSTQYSLSWKRRLEICIGSAEGLDYLHTSSDGGIIHRDVKSTNILLDKNFEAKVADFGISKTGHLDQTYVSTDIKGSIGYLDPEYYGSQQLTEKSDVYSFGVVLLEVLCARPAIDTSLIGEQVNLAEWAMSWQKRGQLEKVIDPRLVGDINPSSLRKFGETADKCLKDFGADRPTMGDVLWDLKYALELQQTVTHKEPHEDSTIDASLQLPLIVIQHLPSRSNSIEKDDVPRARDDGSETTASEVFSQLRIDDPR